MAFLDFVRSLAKRGAPPTLDDLRQALAEADGAIAEARGRCSRLASDRAAVLLDADDKELDRVERSLQLGQRDADRAEAAAAALRERIGVAEAKASRARLDALHERGTAAQQRVITLVRNDYTKAAQKLIAVLEQLEAAEADWTAANDGLREAGDPRRIPDGELMARPHGVTAPDPQRIRLAVRLPSVDVPDMWVWPCGYDATYDALREDRRPEWPDR